MAQEKIHSLDGLRAVAVIMVIISHKTSQNGHLMFTYIGTLGVTLFFVISGYLITTLLLAEELKTGRISYSRFWLRRILRIVPAYFAYVLFLLIIDYGKEGFTLDAQSYLAALTFTTGWFKVNHEVGHLWSLAVEMQFYLLWPLVILFFKSKTRWLIVALFICIAIMSRCIIYHYTGSSWMLAFSSISNMDCILIGCATGMYCFGVNFKSGRLFVNSKLGGTLLLSLVFSCGLLALSHWQKFGILTVPFSKFSISISFALCLVCIVSKNFGFLHALLNSRVMCWIGSLSYSAYLWQQLVLRPGGIAEIFPMLSFADNSFISILNIIIFASVSYYLVEKPLLRMRSKLH